MKTAIIGKSLVDWTNYIAAASQLLNRPVNNRIDELRITTSNPMAFLVSLSTLKDVPYSIENLGSILRHEHYTMIVAGSEKSIVEVIRESGLNVTCDPSGEVAIVSGNLEEWRTAIINGASDSSEPIYRDFVNQAQLCFENIGLGQLWSSYRKQKLKDTTFKLIK